MQINLTEKDIHDAFYKLNVALAAALLVQNELDDFKANLDIDKNRAISKGVEGSNEAVRKANLELMFESEYEHRDALQKQVDRAKLDVTMAENECSAIRNIIRLYQIANTSELQDASASA